MQLSRIKYRHIMCFIEVTRRNSVMKAADSLGITQPAVSKTIRELEDTLGVALFDRSQRSVRLTPFGSLFLRHASASVAALKEGVDSITQASTSGRLMINIGALPTVAASVMPQAVITYKSEPGAAAVRIVTGPNNLLLEQLRLGDLDLVVGRLAAPDRMQGLSFSYLYSEHIVLVVRPGHPLLADQRIDLRRLPEFPVLLPSAQSIIRPLVDRLLIAAGVGPLIDAVESVSVEFGHAYTRSTDAVWFISQGVVDGDIRRGDLVALAVDTGDTSGPVGFTTRVETPPSAALQLFMETTRQVCAEAKRL